MPIPPPSGALQLPSRSASLPASALPVMLGVPAEKVGVVSTETTTSITAEKESTVVAEGGGGAEGGGAEGGGVAKRLQHTWLRLYNQTSLIAYGAYYQAKPLEDFIVNHCGSCTMLDTTMDTRYCPHQ